jgi:hypothetical protein
VQRFTTHLRGLFRHALRMLRMDGMTLLRKARA